VDLGERRDWITFRAPLKPRELGRELPADRAGREHRPGECRRPLRDLAARGLWLEQERIVFDPRILAALESLGEEVP
jgi:hypothetical protein